MRKTSNLKLPIYDNPSSDLFRIVDHNSANESIDKAYGDVKSMYDNIPIKNADAEIVEARGGKTKLNDRLVDTDNFNYDYVLSPQDTMPQKQGTQTETPKIVLKRDNNEILIIQNTNRGYLRHTYNNKNGSVTDSANYGSPYNSIRLVDTRPLESCYVYCDISTPKTGTLTSYSSPQLNANVLEQSFLPIGARSDVRNLSSKVGNFGSGVYSMLYNQTVSFDLTTSYCNRANIAFMATPSSVQIVKILINDILVCSFNPRAYLNAGAIGYGIVEFDVPIQTATTNYDVKIVTEGTSGYFYPACFNFCQLKSYKGQHITDWKAFGSARDGYLTTGASDYALADNNNRWFGSYHGGETLEALQIEWSNILYFKSEFQSYNEDFNNITAGSWRVLEHFSMYQRTDLINKAKMVTITDFNTDGTINMKCSFNRYDNSLSLNAFCTALTCTTTSFDYLFYPEYKYFGATPSNKDYFFDMSEGFVRQVDSSDKLQLDIRHTKFTHRNNKKGSFILDHSYYRKYYYNVISNVSNVGLPSLQFSKALDFYVR